MINKATDGQLGLICQAATGKEKISEINPVLPLSGIR